MKRPARVGLAVGVAIGLVLTAGMLGTGATHLVCSQGPVIGWSGWLATPYTIPLAPPGGLVNSSFWIDIGGAPVYGESTVPQNFSSADTDTLNWSLHSENTATAPGWGSSTPCPGSDLVMGPSAGGCGGCQVAPPATPGVGQRLEVPSRFAVDSALINASYGTTPIASFSWTQAGEGTQWSNLGTGAFPAGVGSFYEYGHLIGLYLQIQVSSIHFGVPIRLTSGTMEIFPASFPESVPGTGYAANMTYVFPSVTDQGTWDVYAAGAGSPYSVGGLVFEQTAT